MVVKLIAYAKSNPEETLYQHTQKLLDNLNIVKSLYYEEIEQICPSLELKNNIWEYLEIVCRYHDFGKINSHFQLKIREAIYRNLKSELSFLGQQNNKDEVNIEQLNQEIKKISQEIDYFRSITKNTKEIVHNLISPAFVYPLLKKLDVDKDTKKILLRSVIFHHYQPSLHNTFEEFRKDDKKVINRLSETLENDIEKNKYMLDNFELGKNDTAPAFEYLQSGLGNINPNLKQFYITIKGLLHRIDHSSSAHLKTERLRIINSKEKLIFCLQKKLIKINHSEKEYQDLLIGDNVLHQFQKNAENYRDKNIILPASTGMGKTEFAINWIGKDKAFYVLPLRVSVNSMYERFCDMFFDDKDNIGLLHGDSLLYGINEDKEIENFYKGNTLDKNESTEESLSIEEHIARSENSKQLSMPLSVTTADQLFTSVFKWKGYEKIYATLMYSKIIIDEPQSYSPSILAMIIYALKEISDLGGKFCFISATIHPLIKEKLKSCIFEGKPLDAVYNPENKHKIKLEEKYIEELKDEIIKNYQSKNRKKILIICNTIKKSQKIYQELKDIGNVKLLNSGFIQRDRKIKENGKKATEDNKEITGILQDFLIDKPVIWISTQIVEASLDIDYDILYTEMASIDALIQRMGRVNRKNRCNRIITEIEDANIIISTFKSSDGYFIYSKEIIEKTKDVLIKKDNKIITEEEKQKMVDEVYLNATSFNHEFETVFTLLEAGGFEASTRNEAQKYFRDITNINVIPVEIYNDNKSIIEHCIEKIKTKKNESEDKLMAMKILNGFTLSLPFYKSKGKVVLELPISKKNELSILNVKYDKNIGIIFENGLEIIDNYL